MLVEYYHWVYGDSLMSGSKRQVVNREKILQIIGKTEETVKYGISVNDILPFLRNIIYS